MRGEHWRILIVVGLAVVLAGQALAGESTSAGVTYLERYHRLSERDVEGRMELADWCRYQGLVAQQVDLLAEVLKLQPGHVTAYRNLIEADAKRVRPVDKAWAGKLQALLGPQFKLSHSPHFTILSDAAPDATAAQGEAMEETYRTFYMEAAKIGLRPMPPAGRLVCVLFERHDDFKDYLRRYEEADSNWSAGFYSWRTNRAAFFHDRDHPVFQDVRDQLAALDQRLAQLRQQMQTATGTAPRMQIQEQVKKATAARDEINARLSAAARLATLGKTRHEATHQLLFNSGIQRRGREYPFWLSEGLATNFELCDSAGHAGPTFVNRYRLPTYRKIQKEGKLARLGELLEEQPREQDDAQWVAGRYAQVWALVHFLWNKRPGELVNYLDALDAEGTPRGWMGFFKKHFGDDIESLEREMRGYVDALAM